MASQPDQRILCHTALQEVWPEYKTEAPLPSELMGMMMGYLFEKKKFKIGVYRGETTLVNGIQHGERRKWYFNKQGKYKECREWYYNGRLCKKAFYVQGKREGALKEWWYSNGRLCKQEFYVQGKKHGECKEWHHNGQLCKQKFYVQGKKHGECREWYKNGIPSVQATYENGKKHGEYKEWFNDGILGILGLQITYVQGKKHGEYKEYHENGEIFIKMTFVNGEKHECKMWNFDGQPL